MKRYTMVAVLMGAAILTTATGASAQRWGREATPRAGVCFYENNNFEGRYFCSPAGATRAQVPNGTNDKISSVRVFGNAEVTVFRDDGFQGQSKVIASDVTNLKRMGFNDRISSYRVDTTRGFGRDRDARGNRGGDWGRDGDGNVRGDARPNGSRWSYRDAEMVVRRSYQSVLGREPDPSGLRSWTEQVINNDWTQRDLENKLRDTEEYRRLRRESRR